MKMYKITNFVIIALVITALYQVNELWLSGSSSHSFFSLIMEKKPEAVQLNEDAFIATRYAVGDGGGIYEIHYPQSSMDALMEQSNEILGEVLSDRSVQSSLESVDWKVILEGRSIVLQYDFPISSSEFFAQYKTLKHVEEMDGFDYITISPARKTNENTIIWFVDSRGGTCVRYTSAKSQTAPELYENLSVEQSDMPYISTGQRTGTSIIWRNLFLPQWTELPYAYAAVGQSATFEGSDGVNRGALENAVKGFFRNFSLDWSTRDDNGNYIFSDSQTVVRYYVEDRILEYYNYDSYGGRGDITGALNGYQVCSTFLANDTSLTNEVYLANIQRRNNEWIYYFDYIVEGIPIYLSEEVQERIGSRHAIEITLRNQMVKRYQRYAMDYVLMPETNKLLDIQFIDALDNANKTYQVHIEEKVITDVSDIALGYYADDGKSLELKWFITLYDTLFVTETNTENIPADSTGEDGGEASVESE